jgi:DNA invertase Pin-like site-specific DNA recombinase
MRIAIYSCVSTKDKGQDTENQLVQLREFASNQGWQIVREFVDRDWQQERPYGVPGDV